MHEHVKNLPPIWHIKYRELSRFVRQIEIPFPNIGVRQYCALSWFVRQIEIPFPNVWKTRVRKSHAVMYMNPDGLQGREAHLLRPLPNNISCSTRKKQSHQAYSHHSATCTIPKSRRFQFWSWSWWYWSGHATETSILLMVHDSYWPGFCMVVEVVLKQHGCSAGTKNERLGTTSE